LGGKYMRVRDLQQILEKFTDGEKGTNISDCPIYIETKDGYMEEVRFIALEKNKLIGSPEPARIILKHENLQRFRSHTYEGPKKNYGI
jgi:hypothetical protein|tara:strand:- start:469 stop:732 length:264 start_codon:yes stop_codon:yes gene_type:complete